MGRCPHQHELRFKKEKEPRPSTNLKKLWLKFYEPNSLDRLLKQWKIVEWSWGFQRIFEESYDLQSHSSYQLTLDLKGSQKLEKDTSQIMRGSLKMWRKGKGHVTKQSKKIKFIWKEAKAN